MESRPIRGRLLGGICQASGENTLATESMLPPAYHPSNRVLSEFQENFAQILGALRTALPNTRIYVSNLYTIPQIAGADQVVPVFNQIVAGVAGMYNVPVADVYSAFLGRRGLLLIERPGAVADEVHPTNAGYEVMAQAFEALVRKRERD